MPWDGTDGNSVGDKGGGKKRVFGDVPEAVNWRQRNELLDLKFSVNSRMLYRWATGDPTTPLFSSTFILLHQADSRHDLSVANRLLTFLTYRGTSLFCCNYAAFRSVGFGDIGDTIRLEEQIQEWKRKVLSRKANSLGSRARFPKAMRRWVFHLQEPRAFFGIRAWLRSTNDFESWVFKLDDHYSVCPL